MCAYRHYMTRSLHHVYYHITLSCVHALFNKPYVFQRFLEVQAVQVRPSWAFLGRLGGILGASWSHLGAILEHLGPSWNRLGASNLAPTAAKARTSELWATLGASWGLLGPSWERLGAAGGQVARILQRCWEVLESSWHS